MATANTGLVVLTIGVVVGTTELNRIVAGNNPTFKPLVGGFVLGIGLFAIDAMNADLGKVFSALLITGSILLNGDPIFKTLSKPAKKA